MAVHRGVFCMKVCDNMTAEQGLARLFAGAGSGDTKRLNFNYWNIEKQRPNWWQSPTSTYRLAYVDFYETEEQARKVANNYGYKDIDVSGGNVIAEYYVPTTTTTSSPSILYGVLWFKLLVENQGKANERVIGIQDLFSGEVVNIE